MCHGRRNDESLILKKMAIADTDITLHMKITAFVTLHLTLTKKQNGDNLGEKNHFKSRNLKWCVENRSNNERGGGTAKDSLGQQLSIAKSPGS